MKTERAAQKAREYFERFGAWPSSRHLARIAGVGRFPAWEGLKRAKNSR